MAALLAKQAPQLLNLDILKRRGDVAFLTLFAQLTGMIVVFLMTTVAITGKLDFFFHSFRVAGMTIQTFMLAIQRIIRQFVVVKIPRHPL